MPVDAMSCSKYSVKRKARINRDGADWIASCPSLEVCTQARTKRGALVSLCAAVELWFESCIERGLLAGALEELGFTKLGKGQVAPADGDIVSLRPRDAVQPKGLAQDLVFSPGSGCDGDYIQGVVPAYITANQLVHFNRAST